MVPDIKFNHKGAEGAQRGREEGEVRKNGAKKWCKNGAWHLFSR
jgi:hypothetical protein